MLAKVTLKILDRLVKDHGNDRQAMIDYHITKLVGLPYSQVVRKMPRGPRGRWYNLMIDIKEDLKHLAQQKANNS